MTKETLQERMTTLSRYFARDKWKAESGFFQYPRGKKRTEAVAEALEIAFDPSEFAIKKELNLRGEDVVGSVFLVAIPTEGIFGGYSYLSLTITDHVFIVTQLPEKSVAALALLENSGEKLVDSVETYEPEHEEDVSMETDTKEKLEEESEKESEKETSVEPETVVKEAEPVKELLKKEMEEALRKEDPVKKTEGEKQIAENETTEEAEIMLDASKDEKTSDISNDEFDLDKEISELEDDLPML